MLVAGLCESLSRMEKGGKEGGKSPFNTVSWVWIGFEFRDRCNDTKRATKGSSYLGIFGAFSAKWNNESRVKNFVPLSTRVLLFLFSSSQRQLRKLFPRISRFRNIGRPSVVENRLSLLYNFFFVIDSWKSPVNLISRIRPVARARSNCCN